MAKGVERQAPYTCTEGMLNNMQSMLAIRDEVLEDQKSEAKKYWVRMKSRIEERKRRSKQASSHDYGMTADTWIMLGSLCQNRSCNGHRKRFFPVCASHYSVVLLKEPRSL